MTENALDIDRTVYPMPQFATLTVRDLATAPTPYLRAGFVVLATIPGPDGRPALVHLRRLRHQDLLLVAGDPRPGSTSVTIAAGGADLDELARRLRAAGDAVEGPAPTPWFTTDLTLRDADGHVLVLTAPRSADAEAAQAWATEAITGQFERPADPPAVGTPGPAR